MIKKTAREHLSEAFEHLADELDVPPSKYRDAQERYRAVGEWLNSNDAEIAKYDPDIYPQGSFALGTVVKPVGDEEYDVDAVCILNRAVRDSISQQRVKNLVGDRLKEHGTYTTMLDPAKGGRRCWTLKYADSSHFHLDILPSIPDPDCYDHLGNVPAELLNSAICITDNTTWDGPILWPTENKSNPKGYAEWFKGRMKVVFEERKEAILASRRAQSDPLHKTAQVEDVPDYEVRTPLQRLIQVLKRHRDLRYGGDDDKPISIIITTLAAHAYDNQENLLDALLGVVPRMRDHIKHIDGVWWVANPVNPDENFANKWEETPRKAQIFFQWLTDVEREHASLLEPGGLSKTASYLEESYGERAATNVLSKTAGLQEASSAMTIAPTRLPSIFNVPHREKPRWPVVPIYGVTVTAKHKRNGGSYIPFTSDSSPLPKHCDLLFSATADVPGNFQVYWQVVNTGEEARLGGGLRGQILLSKTYGRGGLTQKEATLYYGTHWIQCYIVQDGRCVAASDEFIINIQ